MGCFNGVNNITFFEQLLIEVENGFPNTSLTLQAVGIEQVLALFVALHSAFSTAHALASNTPQQTLTLIAVSGSGGCPHLEVVRCGAGNGIYQGLESLLIDMTLLQRYRKD